jgi:putative MATE family efflux protein
METKKPGELSETTARLGTERLSRLFLRLSAPGMASMIAMSFYGLADTFWLGRLSYDALAAITVTWPFYTTVFAIALGSGVGANALASKRFGERDIEATNLVAGQVFPLTVVFGIPFVIVSVLFGRPLAAVLGAPPQIVDLTVSYLIFFGWGIPFVLFRVMARNVFHASGDAKSPMIFIIVGSVVNAVLDPFFIFGWGPFPQLGVGGAGLATTIGGGLTAALSAYHLMGGRSVYRVKLHHLKPDLSIIAQIYRVGLPSVLMDLTEAFVFLMMNRTIAGFGSLALAALGIAGRIADLAFIPVVGLAHALLPIVGFCLGARLWQRLWTAIKQSSLAAGAVLGIASLFLAIFAPNIIGIFNDSPELLAIAVPGMRIFMSAFVLIGPAIMFIISFQALSKGWTAISLSLVRQLGVFLPALLLLPRVLGLTGVWLAMPISDAVGAVVGGFWLYREYKLQKRSGIWDQAPAGGPLTGVLPAQSSTPD